jgi:hypothetical protein
MINIVAFKGATSWEAQIGRLWVRVPYWPYLKCGVWPKVGWERADD